MLRSSSVPAFPRNNLRVEFMSSTTIGGLLVLAALHTALIAPVAAAQQPGDPFEPVNRRIFAFNDVFDTYLLKPVARGYDNVTPDPVQRGIGNVFSNAAAPSVALNQLLQGKPRRALSDFTRFVVNTTMGIGGIFDIASRNGLPEHDEDFGQTFAVWTGGQGAFVTLPGRGPSSVTAAVGMVFDAYTNPVMLISPRRDRIATTAVNIIDTRAGLLASERLISGDEYLFIRDAYLQRREYLINDGVVEEDPFLDDF